MKTYLVTVEYFNGWSSRSTFQRVRADKPEIAAEIAERMASYADLNYETLHKYFARRVETQDPD